jgi:SNF2 family DNA or RNA helicase
MDSITNNLTYLCPFCNNLLESRFSKCYNIYCEGQKFGLHNYVIYKLNPGLGVGKIFKVLDIPTSRSLDEEDNSILKLFKVEFENNIVKIIHPIDLIHYLFSINESVKTHKGFGVINSSHFLNKDGQISYEVLFSDGNVLQIYESDFLIQYITPINKILSQSTIDPPQQFLIKYWANLFKSYYTSYQVKCITNSRLSMMLHQVNVAHRLSEEFFPRVILADEVGLGKTIEAGIFIKEMMARNLAERILIIVPATLVKQWQFELQNKFNMVFTIYDGNKLKELKKKPLFRQNTSFRNPFYFDNLIICSLQFARNRKYIKLLSEISWDIVVFDEAHHLRRYLLNYSTGNYRNTLNYELAYNLSQNSQSLLLLSATPLQLHSFELYSLIELIQREAFDNFSDFEHFRKNMPFINLLITNINQIEKLNNFEVKNTIKLLKKLKYVDTNKDDGYLLTQLQDQSFKSKLLKKIESDHTLSKFLIRNRKKNVFSEDVLNTRIVKTIMVNPTSEELNVYNEIRYYLAKIYNSSMNNHNVGLGFIITTLQKLLTSSKYALLKSLERRLDQIDKLKSLTIDDLRQEDPEFFEFELEDEYIDAEVSYQNYNNSSKNKDLDLINQEKIIREFYNKLKNISYDSKSDKLIELIKEIYQQNHHEKLLIFTQFVDTLYHLKKLLEQQQEAYNVEIFYGGMNKEEKDQAVEQFRSNEGFSILLSTEIGGEGRNFQFARILINYDLPWNPMKLEQRIGRLDRIGQYSKEIYIYNFFLEGTVETDIMFALDKRINLFEESIGQLEPIIGKIEKDIKSIIFTEDDGVKRKKLNEFNRKLDIEIKKARESEMQLDDLLIDRKSFQVDDLITSIAACEEVKLSHNELFLLIKYCFDLRNRNFGTFHISEDCKDRSTNGINCEVLLQPQEELLKKSRNKLSEKYLGTFGLDLAREKEEIDFFALGHPLIDEIINLCLSDFFKGNKTILNVKKGLILESFKKLVNNLDEAYLFIYEVKFQGYIVETQYSAIVLDKFGNNLNGLNNYLLDIANYNHIYKFHDLQELSFNMDKDFLERLLNYSKTSVKQKTSQWKKEIKKLNNKIFKLEMKKREKIYKYNKKAQTIKIEALKHKLELKIHQRPTERQRSNIAQLDDAKKKQDRLEYFERLEEQIISLEKDIIKVEKQIDELSFEYEDRKNEMNKRNLSKFYTNLSSFALIRFND